MALLSNKQKMFWATTAATLIASFLAREAAATTWRKLAHKEPPKKPQSPNVPLQEAILWTLSSGVVISVATLIAGRLIEKQLGKRLKA